MHQRIQLQWLGNACLALRNGQTLLIDPFLSRPDLRAFLTNPLHADPTLQKDLVPHCDHIFVTHAHYDHLLDAPGIAQRSQAHIYGDANTCQICTCCGVAHSQMQIIAAGQQVKAGAFRVSAIRGHHPWLPGFNSGQVKQNPSNSLRAQDYRMGKNFSFLIETGDLRILVWSSTHTQGAVPADVLCVRAVSDQRWYSDLLQAVQPQLVLPTHWDDFFKPLSQSVQPFYGPPRWGWPPIQRIDVQAFSDRVRNALPGCKAFIPERLRWHDIHSLLNSHTE